MRSGNGMAELLKAAWTALVRFHSNQVGAAGDQPDEDEPGEPGADKGGEGGGRSGLTEDALYAGEDAGGGEGDSEPKPKAAAGEEGETGEEGADGGEPAPKRDKGDWDKDRQRRDQEHAAERREMQALVARQAEQIGQLVAALQAAKAPTTKATDDLDALAAEVDALSDESEPGALVAGLKKVTRALMKVRQSSGANADVIALQGRIEELTANLEDTRTRLDASSQTDVTRQRKQVYDAVVAECQKTHGPQHTAKALARARKYFLDRGYDPERPETWPTAAEEQLAVRNAFLETAAAAKPAKKPGDKDVTLDAPKGGGPVKVGRKTGTLKQVLNRMKHEGKLA